MDYKNQERKVYNTLEHNEHSTNCLIDQFSFQADALPGYRAHM